MKKRIGMTTNERLVKNNQGVNVGENANGVNNMALKDTVLLDKTPDCVVLLEESSIVAYDKFSSERKAIYLNKEIVAKIAKVL
jgi:hypothetical protein